MAITLPSGLQAIPLTEALSQGGVRVQTFCQLNRCKETSPRIKYIVFNVNIKIVFNKLLDRELLMTILEADFKIQITYI